MQSASATNKCCPVQHVQRIIKGGAFGISCFAVNRKLHLVAVAEKVRPGSSATTKALGKREGGFALH